MKKQVLVTGGSGGIGSAIARAFADQGYEVVATGLTEQELSALPDYKGISYETLDVSNQEDVLKLINQFDSLDVVVNAAGIILREGKEFTLEGFLKVIDVNLSGTMRVCLAAKPLLREGSSIINVASMLSFVSGPLVPAYTASKGGIAQLTKALAAAWAKDGIRVNAIAPGWIETELTSALRQDESRSKVITDRTPMGRWGKPDDLAGAVRFLASEEAGFITGVILPIDGGYLTL
ncbi:MAG: SDR family oxidoreductase [Trueperaceae bacterium]|nr:SDR family oxidoreductase [Trueperaceae bacterium]